MSIMDVPQLKWDSPRQAIHHGSRIDRLCYKASTDLIFFLSSFLLSAPPPRRPSATPHYHRPRTPSAAARRHPFTPRASRAPLHYARRRAPASSTARPPTPHAAAPLPPSSRTAPPAPFQTGNTHYIHKKNRREKGMKKYGLQLRIPPAQKKQAASRPPLRPSSVFATGDDDDGIEQEISRQAAKNKALQKVEEQHKKAMEEDPSVFDYDGVYDDMKEKMVRPKIQDRVERQSKYIGTLMETAKKREMEREVVYERKLLKERSKEDHLYAGKEKFVTSAYKKKLAEQAKWLEEERLRQMREEQEDVTKKGDLSDFYFGLNKNVAFGARSEESTKITRAEQIKDNPEESEQQTSPKEALYSDRKEKDDSSHAETSYHDQDHSKEVVVREDASANITSGNNKNEGEQLPSVEISERYKRTDDAVAAARERFLARKRTREQL